jgi:large subunit ribosomal protein L9
VQVILIEKDPRLGDIGDITKVKDGYARNYLLPRKKAIVATEANKKLFELKREEIRKEFEAKCAVAESVKSVIDAQTITVTKQADEDGKLYGSVTASEILAAIKEQLHQDLPKSSIHLPEHIKTIGTHMVNVEIFADVSATVSLVVAQSQE